MIPSPAMKNILTVALACASLPSVAWAQTAASAERPPLRSVLEVDMLRDLPASANLFSILESTQPAVSTDRFHTGGLATGEPSRLGAQLASPAQNLFRIGDLNITDPEGSGAPMLFPELQYWQRMS